MNHNAARGIFHDGTGSWFTESDTFKEWKLNGSLLWVHGKRMRSSHLLFNWCPDGDFAHLVAGSGNSILW